MSNYKNCYVPECRSTSRSTPNKIFITVPINMKLRKVWLKAARRNGDVSPNSHLYCCEDHFNLAEDMENYMEFKMMGVKIRMKKNVVPHIFTCQYDKKHTAPRPLRPGYAKRLRLRIIDEMLSQPSNSTSQQELETINEIIPQPSTSQQRLVENLERRIETKVCAPSLPGLSEEKTLDIGKNVNLRPSFRSKAVMFNILPSTINVACSPLKQPDTLSKLVNTLNYTCREEKSNQSHTINSESSNFRTYDSESEFSENVEDPKSLVFKSTNIYIARKPKMYLGISRSWYKSNIIDFMSRKTNLSVRDINLTLMKIKLNDSFERLGDMFGVSESVASEIFNKSVICLSKYLKQLIFWPDKETIMQYLPISFRHRYSNVESIIDCLEIEISKPSDPIQQSLTWTGHKKCNTLKYLISSTPDGFINFVSEGYDGRITDVQLLEQNTNYLHLLPEGCGVLADKGFKGILPLIKNRNCQLMTLPSVPAGTKSTKEEVLLIKSIANLRIHIERVTSRLREFEMLKPHSVVHSSLISIIDKIIIIAAGLVNLQIPIIN